MKFLVYEKRKGGELGIRDYGELVGTLTDWLVNLRDLSSKGIVTHHWAFEGAHGSVTVYDVGSAVELEEILSKSPLTPDLCHREVFPVVTLDKAIDHLQHFMSGV